MVEYSDFVTRKNALEDLKESVSEDKFKIESLTNAATQKIIPESNLTS